MSDNTTAIIIIIGSLLFTAFICCRGDDHMTLAEADAQIIQAQTALDQAIKQRSQIFLTDLKKETDHYYWQIVQHRIDKSLYAPIDPSQIMQVAKTPEQAQADQQQVNGLNDCYRWMQEPKMADPQRYDAVINALIMMSYPPTADLARRYQRMVIELPGTYDERVRVLTQLAKHDQPQVGKSPVNQGPKRKDKP